MKPHVNCQCVSVPFVSPSCTLPELYRASSLGNVSLLKFGLGLGQIWHILVLRHTITVSHSGRADACASMIPTMPCKFCEQSGADQHEEQEKQHR